MALKSFYTNLINTKIRNKTPRVIKTEHADVHQSLVDGEIYSAPVREISSGTNANTTPVTNIFYNFFLKKSGNQTVISGYFTNNNSGLIANTKLCVIS